MEMQSLYFTVPSSLLDSLTRYGVEELAQRLAINSSVSNTQIAFFQGSINGICISSPSMHQYALYAQSVVVDLLEQWGHNAGAVKPLVLPPHMRWHTVSVHPDLTIASLKHQLLACAEELQKIHVAAKITMLLPQLPLSPQLLLETDAITHEVCNNTHMKLKASYNTGALKPLLPPALLFTSPICWRGVFNLQPQQTAL